MGPAPQAADVLPGNNASKDAGENIFPDDALEMLAGAFEIDWKAAHTSDVSEGGSWPLGKTVWLSIFVSAVLWAGIAGITFFI